VRTLPQISPWLSCSNTITIYFDQARPSRPLLVGNCQVRVGEDTITAVSVHWLHKAELY